MESSKAQNVEKAQLMTSNNFGAKSAQVQPATKPVVIQIYKFGFVSSGILNTRLPKHPALYPMPMSHPFPCRLMSAREATVATAGATLPRSGSKGPKKARQLPRKRHRTTKKLTRKSWANLELDIARRFQKIAKLY